MVNNNHEFFGRSLCYQRRRMCWCIVTQWKPVLSALPLTSVEQTSNTFFFFFPRTTCKIVLMFPWIICSCPDNILTEDSPIMRRSRAHEFHIFIIARSRGAPFSWIVFHWVTTVFKPRPPSKNPATICTNVTIRSFHNFKCFVRTFIKFKANLNRDFFV